jgi:hypothetical protein
MGGFHQLRVLQRIIYKRHACKGYQSWWVDAGTIAFGSSENAFNGGHYYRNMRLHKGSFNALVQFRAEKITSGFREIDPNLKLKLQQLSSARPEVQKRWRISWFVLLWNYLFKNSTSKRWHRIPHDNLVSNRCFSTSCTCLCSQRKRSHPTHASRKGNAQFVFRI